MKENRSRRKFLFGLGILTMVFTIPASLFVSNKMKDEEEYIVMNGWLLKKKDLNDL